MIRHEPERIKPNYESFVRPDLRPKTLLTARDDEVDDSPVSEPRKVDGRCDPQDTEHEFHTTPPFGRGLYAY